MSVAVQRARDAAGRQAFWVYLAGVAAAELVTAAFDARVGMGMHLLLLFVILIYGARAEEQPARQLALALTLAPLIRLLGLALPLPLLPQIAWYPAVSAPLFITGWLIIRQTGLTRADLALVWGRRGLNLALVGSGVGLGVLEYSILAPRVPLAAPTAGGLALVAVTLTVFTGMSEELFFRGILQSLGLRALGPSALLYVSLLFGALHIGYLSLVDIVFVSTVGLLFALAIAQGAALWATTLAHGVTNVILLQIAPLHAGGLLPAWGEPLFIGLMIVGGFSLLVVLVMVLGGAARSGRREPALGEQTPRPASAD
jgi:membrane protease YdiL (CAAX protease family)